jgi:N-acetylglutamate synthase-like GNAT family acetyltransferase
MTRRVKQARHIEETTMNIRPALPSDAEAAIELVRRSITQLCVEDHQNDSLTLQGWLANKSAKNMRAWIETPGSFAFVAERDSDLVGVGVYTGAGDLLLLYVAPEARFSGISSALLKHMEDSARALRLPSLQVSASRAARRFFLERGYLVQAQDDDIFESELGPEDSNEMAKAL